MLKATPAPECSAEDGGGVHLIHYKCVHAACDGAGRRAADVVQFYRQTLSEGNVYLSSNKRVYSDPQALSSQPRAHLSPGFQNSMVPTGPDKLGMELPCQPPPPQIPPDGNIPCRLMTPEHLSCSGRADLKLCKHFCDFGAIGGTTSRGTPSIHIYVICGTAVDKPWSFYL